MKRFYSLSFLSVALVFLIASWFVFGKENSQEHTSPSLPVQKNRSWPSITSGSPVTPIPPISNSNQTVPPSFSVRSPGSFNLPPAPKNQLLPLTSAAPQVFQPDPISSPSSQPSVPTSIPGSTATPLKALLATAQVISSRESAPDDQGIIQRVKIAKTDFQYPFIRIEETVNRAGGIETIESQTATVANHLIVKLKPGAHTFELNTIASKYGATILYDKLGPDTYIVQLHEVHIDSLPEAIDQFTSEVSVVSYAEPDFIVYALDVPNDPDFSQLWGLNNTGQTGGSADADIDAPEAWQSSKGSQTIKVGVIDTGVDYNHPDLAANIWTNPNEIPNNGIDDDQNGYIDDTRGWDFVNGDKDPYDDHYHGTHVSGTIGAVGNNGIGIAGVSWNVSIVPLKFLSAQGYGSTSNATRAVRYATSVGATLTSNSWGGGGYSQALKDAIDEANAAGILFVAAAGNEGVNIDVSPSYPASYTSSNIISVAATNASDLMASFSNYGNTSVDLGAPGVNIYSTYPTSRGSYASISGTSMATPHVAGACVLIKASNPNFSASQIKDRILTTVDPLPALAGKSVSGGRLNVARAIPNNAPVVNAGPDLAMTISSPAILDATVSDDGFPNPPSATTITWNQISGPGTATFLNATSIDTTVSFSAQGTYLLRLTANDGALVSSDIVQVIVTAPVVGTFLADVIWKETVNTTPIYSTPGNGSTLTKNNIGDNWGLADAASAKMISGDGFVQFKFAQTNKDLMVGLTAFNADRDYISLDYAVYGEVNGMFHVYEKGVDKGSFGNYNTSDLFKINRTGTTITYHKNGVVFYTSAVTTSRSLVMDTSFYGSGGSIINCQQSKVDSDGDGLDDQWELYYFGDLSQLPAGDFDADGVTNLIAYINGASPVAFKEDVAWTDTFNTTATNPSPGSGSRLDKTAGEVGWNTAGAGSAKRIADDGFVQFRFGRSDKHVMVGLSASNLDSNYATIGYAIFGVADGSLQIFEKGNYIGIFGSYTPADIFKVERIGTTIIYRKNEMIFYISRTPSSDSLIVDTSLYSTGSFITNCQLTKNNNDRDNDGMDDQWESYYFGNLNQTANGDYDNDGVNNVTEYLNGTSPIMPQEDVQWRDMINSSASYPNSAQGSRLDNLSVNVGWNTADAVSSKSIPGDMFFRFRLGQSNKHLMVGVSNANPDRSYASLDYAIFGVADSSLQIFEKGNFKGAFGSYTPSDYFVIERIGTTINYKKNGVTFYTSLVPSISPLLVDVAFYSPGAFITNCQYTKYNSDSDSDGMDDSWELYYFGNLNQTANGDYDNDGINNITEFTNGTSPIQGEEDIIWINAINTLATSPSPGLGSRLDKTGTTAGWNTADGVSSTIIPADGFVQFKFGQTDKHIMVSLSYSNPDRNYASLDYAIFGAPVGSLQIYEKGTYRGTFGDYTVSDVLKIERRGSVINYLKNGLLIYSSTVSSSGAFLVDTSFYSPGAFITNCRKSR